MKQPIIRALLGVFVLLSAAIYALNYFNPQFSLAVLMGGNLIVLLISIAAFAIVSKTFKERPQAFVRGVMGGTMVKFFACIVAMLIYVLLYRNRIYKPEIFMLLAIYAVYSIVETIMLSRMAKVTG